MILDTANDFKYNTITVILTIINTVLIISLNSYLILLKYQLYYKIYGKFQKNLLTIICS